MTRYRLTTDTEVEASEIKNNTKQNNQKNTQTPYVL